MLDAHARRGFPDWLTVAATCRAVFSEAQPPKLRHARLSHDRRHLRLPADLRATAKRAEAKTGMAQVDPQMAKVVSLCKRRDGKLLPVAEQSRQWLTLRDQIAAANYDLAYSAARKQAARNLHLPREVVPCVFCPGSSCTRCRGSGRYKAQPDLERLAYAGLLEAIWRFDTAKAHCLSSFAVHLMKQSMMTLLRQTPVHFPQDLLRDRREIVAESRRLTKAAADALAAFEEAARLRPDHVETLNNIGNTLKDMGRLAAAEEALKNVHDAPRGALKITASHGIGAYWLLPRLGDFRDQLIGQLPEELAAEIPPIPPMGTLELESVMASEYFFA